MDLLTPDMAWISRRAPVELGFPTEPFDLDLQNQAYWICCALLLCGRDSKAPFPPLLARFARAREVLVAVVSDLPEQEPHVAEGMAAWHTALARTIAARRGRHPLLGYFREVAIAADQQAANKAVAISPPVFDLSDVRNGRLTGPGADQAPLDAVLLISRPSRGQSTRRAVFALPVLVTAEGLFEPPSNEEDRRITFYRTAVHDLDGSPLVEIDEGQTTALARPLPETSWPTYLDDAIERMQAVLCGVPLQEAGRLWDGLDAGDLVWSCVRAEDLAGTQLARIYGELDMRQELPALLKAWMQGREPKPQGISELPVADHLGHMDNWDAGSGQRRGFALDPTQRLAAVAASSIRDDHCGIVVPVNGPPGTGKTSFLRSVIASYWIADALAERDMPRVIVGTGATNKAVSNVIEAFSGVASPAGSGIAARWIPGVPSYGWFLPSQQAKARFPHLMWLETAGKGRLGPAGAAGELKEEIKKRFEAVLEQYLIAAKDALGMDGAAVDLDSVVKLLLTRMRAVTSAMDVERRAVVAPMAQLQRCWEDLQSCGLGARGRAAAELAISRNQLEQGQAACVAKATLHELALEAYRARDAYKGGWRSLLPEQVRRTWMSARWLAFQQAAAQLPAGMTVDEWVSQTINDLNSARQCLVLREGDVTRAQDRLASVIALRAATIRALRAMPAGIGSARWWLRALSYPDRVTHLIEARLDDPDRFTLFHLAARYWEGRWLDYQRQVLAGEIKDQLGPAAWMMLAPIVVATTNKLQHLIDDGVRPDVLIMDEAGQCATHMAFFLGAYARNAVLVGDVDQLEPIYPITPAHAAQLAVASGAGEVPDAVCSASGSMMTVAQRASSVRDDGPRPGLELRYHYRCHPDIADYCNQLMYGGRMINRAPAPDPDPLVGFHLIWVPVPGQPVKVGSSWRNDAEIDAIADWIERNHARMSARYGAPLDEVLAVVTPLGAQASALKVRLKRRLQGVIENAVLERMTLGTVHALQGAERPIVAFSLVQHRGYFADSGSGRLMNVAVSRAKKQFVVFGEPTVTGTGPIANLYSRCNVLSVPDKANA
ncbi:MAG: AAA domain-containing protein [Pseudomonas sp.]